MAIQKKNLLIIIGNGAKKEEPMRNVKMRHIRPTMRCCRKAADD